jgi:acetylornithine deacetylase
VTDRREGAQNKNDRPKPQPATTDMLRQLVGFDTTSRNSNLDLIGFVRDYLRDHGIDSQLLRDDSGRKANLYATIGPNLENGGLMLSGHTDVVPVDDQDWHSDPFSLTEHDGNLYGRGACDMKGFIATALALVPTFRESALNRPIHLAFTFDEEVGCIGARQLADQLRGIQQRPAFCVIGEPTSMRVVDGHKGRFAMRCHVHGVEGHSAFPQRACNAVEVAADMIAYLRQMARRLRDNGPFDAAFDPPHTTVQTGTVRGGTALNIVPRHCSFEFEIRNLPAQNPLALVGELRTFATEQLLPEMRLTASGASIDFEQLSHVPGLLPDRDHDFVRTVLAASGGNATHKVSFGTEAGLYQDAGIATVVCGPGDIAQAHRPDEFVALDQLARCETFLLRMAKEICST